MKTTLKFKLRTPRNKSGCSKLMLLITRHRVTKSYSTSYVLSPDEWDENRQVIIISENASLERQKELAKFSRDLTKDTKFIHKALETLEEYGDYSSEDLIEAFHEHQEGILFCEYIKQRVEDLKTAQRFSAAKICQIAGSIFFKFLGNKDIRIDEINVKLLRSFETYLLSTDRSRNTSATYLRSLRAVYNQAVRESRFFKIMKPKKNPFSGVFTEFVIHKKW